MLCVCLVLISQKYQHLLGGRGGQPSEDEPTMDEESMAALAAKSYRPGDADEEDRPGQDDDIEVVSEGGRGQREGSLPTAWEQGFRQT